ncbi:MAG: histidine ammonia-lyase [Flavobacteriaceae bacterium]|nr:histidine ammonia-lyase [Flavobacteriaceae bacterium]
MYQIDQTLLLDHLQPVASGKEKVNLSKPAQQRITRCRRFLDKQMKDVKNVIYGVNTGFGSLCNTVIPNEELGKLQENLLLSHACGTGGEVPSDIVRLMLVLKIQSLALGHSGVRTETVQLLTAMLNNDMLPVVYDQGSLGASGDLAPLAHLALPIIGKGEVNFEGTKIAADKALKKLGIEPLALESKEGLALINGTQFMSAYGVHILLKTKNLLNWANHIAAMSFEAFDGRVDAFDPDIQRIRSHAGQIEVADSMMRILRGSTLATAKKEAVQDPYSFRCIPQVHGASHDVYTHVHSVFEKEINSVTDNPNIFPDEWKIVSGGNFHGQVLALALDYLCMAIHELGNISERRTYQLISGQRGLPAFLSSDPGLNSGFMIPQYTAASIVSQNKQLCTPASADSIVSSNGQEDHVSMGANAATKCLRICNNVEQVLAIELMTAAQALNFRDVNSTSPTLQKLHTAFRKEVPVMNFDGEQLSLMMSKSLTFMGTYTL